MAVSGWIVDKSAAIRVSPDVIAQRLQILPSQLFVCPVGELEQLYSSRSAADYEERKTGLHLAFAIAAPPPDVFDRALVLQRDLAQHHGMWHRVPIPDLLIAETALFHGFGVVHVDRDFDRIGYVRQLPVHRIPA